MSRSKAKGTAAETAIVRYLRAAGFVQAERRTLSGAHDRGDIAGLPGVVIEVKNCARDQLPAWVAEAELERDNDGASLGVVWHKARGTTDPGRWFVTMSGAQFAALLREQQGLGASPDRASGLADAADFIESETLAATGAPGVNATWDALQQHTAALAKRLRRTAEGGAA